MTYKNMDFYELTSDRMRNAQLFASRNDMISSFSHLVGGVIGEVGVALGGFSEVIISKLRPSHFYAFDTFEMHKWPEHWGKSSAEIFGDKTHRDFYAEHLNRIGAADTTIMEGLSHEQLPICADGLFDMLYIDAAHTYDGVNTDARLACQKLKPSSTIIFNDYIMFDHLLGAEYGVVQAVNNLVAEGEWFVVGFALQKHMFCDIALRRYL